MPISTARVIVSSPNSLLSSMTPTGSWHTMKEALPAVVRSSPSVMKTWKTKKPTADPLQHPQIGAALLPEEPKSHSAISATRLDQSDEVVGLRRQILQADFDNRRVRGIFRTARRGRAEPAFARRSVAEAEWRAGGLVAPWKYGFKSAKSIVRIRFTETQSKNAWAVSAPSEYGFYSNVTPAVDHPRWSRANEGAFLTCYPRGTPGCRFFKKLLPRSQIRQSKPIQRGLTRNHPDLLARFYSSLGRSKRVSLSYTSPEDLRKQTAAIATLADLDSAKITSHPDARTK